MSTYLLSKGINADAYLFVPCYYKVSIEGLDLAKRKFFESNDLPEILEKINHQEIDKHLRLSIKRCYVNEIKFHLESD